MLPSYQLSLGQTFCSGTKSGPFLLGNTIQNSWKILYSPVCYHKKTLDNRTPSVVKLSQKTDWFSEKRLLCLSIPLRAIWLYGSFAGPPFPSLFTTKRKKVPKKWKIPKSGPKTVDGKVYIVRFPVSGPFSHSGFGLSEKQMQCPKEKFKISASPSKIKSLRSWDCCRALLPARWAFSHCGAGPGLGLGWLARIGSVEREPGSLPPPSSLWTASHIQPSHRPPPSLLCLTLFFIIFCAKSMGCYPGSFVCLPMIPRFSLASISLQIECIAALNEVGTQKLGFVS